MTTEQVADEPLLIDIGGRRLATRIAGSGTPAVVLIGGVGLDMRLWRRVVPGVATFTTVIAYDRAGLGDSDPPPGMRLWGGAADDLAALLAAVDVAPPYVIVAHSGGGYIASIFSHRHPPSVAGWVLLDADHPEFARRAHAFVAPDELERLRADRVRVRSRTLGGEQLDPDPTHTDPEIARCWPPVAAPAVVLIRGVHDETQHPFNPPSCEEREVLHHELQADITASLPGSIQRVVAGSGHFIPREAPDEVVAAIRAVVTAVRTGQPVALV